MMELDEEIVVGLVLNICIFTENSFKALLMGLRRLYKMKENRKVGEGWGMGE